jgi:hypothetical protein
VGLGVDDVLSLLQRESVCPAHTLILPALSVLHKITGVLLIVPRCFCVAPKVEEHAEKESDSLLYSYILLPKRDIVSTQGLAEAHMWVISSSRRVLVLVAAFLLLCSCTYGLQTRYVCSARVSVCVSMCVNTEYEATRICTPIPYSIYTNN